MFDVEIPTWYGVFRVGHLLLLDETWVELFVYASGVISHTQIHRVTYCTHILA